MLKTIGRICAVGVVLVASIVVYTETVVACSCKLPPPPRAALEEVDAVFAGSIVSLRNDDRSIIATVRVKSVWKGELGRFTDLSTADNTAACGVVFTPGDEYIVYAYGGGEEALSTFQCTRTRPFDPDEAAALGKPVRVIDETQFLRGDANGDGELDISDGTFALNYLFLGGRAPTCDKAADSDDDGRLRMNDAVFVFSFLFRGGVELPKPSIECGPDPSVDALDCAEYESCG